MLMAPILTCSHTQLKVFLLCSHRSLDFAVTLYPEIQHVGVRHAMGLCELLCKRDRLREELTILKQEMSNYISYVDGQLQAIQARTADMDSAASHRDLDSRGSGRSSSSIGSGSTGNRGPSRAAVGGVATQQYLGYTLEEPGVLHEQVQRGLAALLLQAKQYYSNLRGKGQAHLEPILAGTRPAAPLAGRVQLDGAARGGQAGGGGRGSGQVDPGQEEGGSRGSSAAAALQRGRQGGRARGRGNRAGARQRRALEQHYTTADWQAQFGSIIEQHSAEGSG